MFFVLRWALRIVGLVVAGAFVYYCVCLAQVWLESTQNDPHPAGAILVMGAAQYNGVPSPDLKARLEEALSLYDRRLSKLIAVTGGKQPGDRYTEAQASASWLEERGVPAGQIVQGAGDDSWQNVSSVAPRLKALGVRKVLVVTDGFHEYRSMAIASDQGLDPSPTPARDSPISGWGAFPYFLKEGLGVAIGRVWGYQNLHALG